MMALAPWRPSFAVGAMLLTTDATEAEGAEAADAEAGTASAPAKAKPTTAILALRIFIFCPPMRSNQLCPIS
jgi:hypothetical protein